MLVYGLTSSGMTINLHYCCGKLDGISIFAKEQNSCKSPNHEKNNGCCNDKLISASLPSDQQLAVKWVQAGKQNFDSLPFQAAKTSFTELIISKEKLSVVAAENASAVPIFLKNCVFRI